MAIVQLTLMKGVYKNPELLQDALTTVKTVGEFRTFDIEFASRIGVISGELPEDRIPAVESLDVVSALQRNELMRAFG